MDDIDLTPFRKDHLGGAVALSQRLGWLHRHQDWEMLLPFSKGFVALQEDRVVGTVLRSDFGQSLSTVNMVIVSEELRGQGLGRALVASVLSEEVRSLRLISTISGRPLYEKLGFREVAHLVQHQGEAPSVPYQGVARRAETGDLPTLQKLESQSFGGDRSALMAWLAETANLSVVCQNGEVTGFAGCRRFGRGSVIGPVVAASAEDARALISFHLHALAGQFVRLDVMQNSGLSSWLRDIGLPAVDRPPVMERGAISATPQRMALFSQALG